MLFRSLLTAFQRGRWRVRLASPTRVRPAPPSTLPASEPRPEFTFAFQPIVDARVGQVVGYEALIRGPDDETAAEVLQRVSLA